MGEGPEAVKLLSRVEQLRLLSKVKKAGLHSAAENFGLSLSSIEKLGLLSKAEDFGVLSTATDLNTPATLFTAALVLLITGPLVVYLIPEDSSPLVVLQVVVGDLTALGGSIAFAASNLYRLCRNPNNADLLSQALFLSPICSLSIQLLF